MPSLYVEYESPSDHLYANPEVEDLDFISLCSAEEIFNNTETVECGLPTVLLKMDCERTSDGVEKAVE